MKHRLLLMALACACAEDAADCPQPLVDDVVACVEDGLADTEMGLSLDEWLDGCADAEPLADAYDAWCAADPGPAECSMTYEDAWQALGPPCRDAAAAVLAP